MDSHGELCTFIFRTTARTRSRVTAVQEGASGVPCVCTGKQFKGLHPQCDARSQRAAVARAPTARLVRPGSGAAAYDEHRLLMCTSMSAYDLLCARIVENSRTKLRRQPSDDRVVGRQTLKNQRREKQHKNAALRAAHFRAVHARTLPPVRRGRLVRPPPRQGMIYSED